MPYFDLVLLHILLAICCYTDKKYRKIYNHVIAPFLIIGLINTFLLYPMNEAFIQLFYILPIAFICFLLFKLKQFGGGDAKLIITIFAIIGFWYSLNLVFISFLISWIYIFISYLISKVNKIKQDITVPMGVVMFIGLIILDIVYYIN